MIEGDFSTAFARVKELAGDFQAGEQQFLDSTYSEAQARKDFIDKFWIALGWDVNHEREKNPYRQEVKIESSVKTGERKSERTRKADYAFYAAPNFRDVKFFVEAKKPAQNLTNADYYFQTIRYGFSADTPLAVLTDFEEFHILYCRSKPDINTALSYAVRKFNYRDYADEEKFREIYHLFSREAVAAGSLEEFVKELPKFVRDGKRKKLFAFGVQKSLDAYFLDDLDRYREMLARAFKSQFGDKIYYALTLCYKIN